MSAPSVALRHVCRRCGRHFLLCEAEGCRPAVMPAADAIADAETLLLNSEDGSLVQRAARMGLEAVRRARLGYESTAHDRARKAARNAFRDVPGLRGLHTRDEHCDVDPETFTCRTCGVYHDPAGCEGCGGHGFHRVDSCPVQLSEYEAWRTL